MGIIFESTKYNLNFFEDKFFNKYLEKRDDEGDYGNNGDNGDNGGYNQNDQGQVTEQPVQPQSTVPQSSGGSGGGSYTPINLDEVQNNKEEEKSFLDIPMEIIRSKYFLIGCGAFVGLVILFFLLRYLIRHRKKPDLSKNFNRNYTKARDIIKHPDAESLSFDSRDEASGNLYRIESTDSMVKMFHSTDITYEKNNGSMNNSMVNLSQVPKNVSPLTPAHLINNQKSQSDLTNNAHSLPNMPSSSSSISSQDSRTLINNRSRTFSSSNSNGTVKPQRRSRTNSSRARSSSTYYMSSDFVMTPFITKKIPGLEKNVPSEEEFVDYPPTPLPESLDDIPYSDNPDIDSEDTDNIVPPSEQIQKRAHSLPSSQNSPVSNRQMSPEHSQSQPMPQVPVRKHLNQWFSNHHQHKYQYVSNLNQWFNNNHLRLQFVCNLSQWFNNHHHNHQLQFVCNHSQGFNNHHHHQPQFVCNLNKWFNNHHHNHQPQFVCNLNKWFNNHHHNQQPQFVCNLNQWFNSHHRLHLHVNNHKQ